MDHVDTRRTAVAEVIQFPTTKRSRYTVRYWVEIDGVRIVVEKEATAFSLRDALWKASREHWDQLFGPRRCGHVISVVRAS